MFISIFLKSYYYHFHHFTSSAESFHEVQAQKHFPSLAHYLFIVQFDLNILFNESFEQKEIASRGRSLAVSNSNKNQQKPQQQYLFPLQCLALSKQT